MSAVTQSYLKVHYELRPAKQVERRMIVDGIQRLGLAGFNIDAYEYIGMGSIYFVDFILFHKWLGIATMISAEHDLTIPKRVDFNKPFGHVRIALQPVGELLASLSPEAKSIVWLDYDDTTRASHLIDLIRAGTYLSPGSILLVTVDVDPPADPDGNKTDDPKVWREYFEQEAGAYLGQSIRISDFAESRLRDLNARILLRAIKRGLNGRPFHFLPLFYFSYADGHEMITLGGMIGSRRERRRITRSSLAKTAYARTHLPAEPFRITVPKVTRKERLHLDSAMPCGENWRPEEFEIDPDAVRAYREVYRFLPAYAELLL
jgi:Putative O-methyltransferase